MWVCSRQEKSYGLKLYSGFPEFIKIALTKLDGSDILSLPAFNTLWDFKRCWNCFVLFFPANRWEIFWIFKVGIKISVFCTV